jgi:hypothetical protein
MSDSLLLAGKICGDQAANLRSNCGCFIALEIIHFARKENTAES